ncbi:MAG: AAA family ATPase [Xanthomonadales bacterium]|nr:AAA family ATPase [Xanthomonadales bacterium]
MSRATRTTASKSVRRLALNSAEEFDAARLALRLLLTGLPASRLERLIDRSWDDDWNDLIGVEMVHKRQRDDFDDESARLSKATLKAQLKWLDGQPAPGIDRIANAIDELAMTLRLDDTDKAVLHATALIHRNQALRELVDQCGRSMHGLEAHDLLAIAQGLSRRAVKSAIARTGRLQRYSLIEWSRHYGVPEPDDDFMEWLNEDDAGIARFLAQRLRRSPAPGLSLDDFPHLPDVDRMRQLLATAVGQQRPGVNVLIYGPPGTGKTELARALARECGIELHEVPVASSDGEPISGERRLGAFAFAQRLMTEHGNAAMLFDEVEDVFGAGMNIGGLFGFNPGYRPIKGWINDQLESNPVPTFWLSNDIGAIDPAHIRRFDEVIELRVPPIQVRRRIVSRHFGTELISADCIERIAAIDSAPPAQIERTARAVATLYNADAGQHPSDDFEDDFQDDVSAQAVLPRGKVCQRDATALRLLENSLRAMGTLRHLPRRMLPEHYDPALLNIDADLDAIATRLQHQPEARLCLYGPPGTGKTAFAHHLAERLNRPLLVRRASDLLSKWVGESEANIANAFQRARDEGAVLLIDEADSFLRERANARQSWEVTQVNEMLTQMEHFDGVFIASTNLLDQLDTASLRRFDYKLKFGYLRREQRAQMFRRLCADLASPDSEEIDMALQAIDKLHLLTPGDFAVVRRQFRYPNATPSAQDLLRCLEAETAIKPEGRQRAIGFTVH